MKDKLPYSCCNYHAARRKRSLIGNFVICSSIKSFDMEFLKMWKKSMQAVLLQEQKKYQCNICLIINMCKISETVKDRFSGFFFLFFSAFKACYQSDLKFPSLILKLQTWSASVFLKFLLRKEKKIPSVFCMFFLRIFLFFYLPKCF